MIVLFLLYCCWSQPALHSDDDPVSRSVQRVERPELPGSWAPSVQQCLPSPRYPSRLDGTNTGQRESDTTRITNKPRQVTELLLLGWNKISLAGRENISDKGPPVKRLWWRGGCWYCWYNTITWDKGRGQMLTPTQSFCLWSGPVDEVK